MEVDEKRVLIVEDELTIANLIQYNLKKIGYQTNIISEGNKVLQELMREEYDVVLLDVMLPGIDGFQVLANIRKSGLSMPVIMVTARNLEEEIVQGLMNGADDYIVKPFGLAELTARMNAVLRRSPNIQSSQPESLKQLKLGGLIVYPEKYEVYYKSEAINLRPKEFQILLCLQQSPGKIFTRDELMNLVWGYDYFGDQRTVDVHVSSLRKKIEPAADTIKIEAIRGVGYKLILL